LRDERSPDLVGVGFGDRWRYLAIVALNILIPRKPLACRFFTGRFRLLPGF
jgi:hypothetical protein